MRATSWRIRKVGRQWQIFEPGWAITPIAWTSTFPTALRLLPMLKTYNVTTKRPVR